MNKRTVLAAILIVFSLVINGCSRQGTPEKFNDLTFDLPKDFQADTILNPKTDTSAFYIKDKTFFIQWTYNAEEPKKNIKEYVEMISMLNSYDSNMNEISKSYTKIAGTEAGILEYYKDSINNLDKTLNRGIYYDVLFYHDGFYQFTFSTSTENALITKFDKETKKNIRNILKSIEF